MNIYIAASFSLKDEVRKLYTLFKSYGHEITVDWTTHEGTTPEERDEKAELMEEYLMEDLRGIGEADVFVLLSGGPPGKGRFIEFGVALHSLIMTGAPRIFVVGDHTNESIFYYHPSVQRRGSIDEILREL